MKQIQQKWKKYNWNCLNCHDNNDNFDHYNNYNHFHSPRVILTVTSRSTWRHHNTTVKLHEQWVCILSATIPCTLYSFSSFVSYVFISYWRHCTFYNIDIYAFCYIGIVCIELYTFISKFQQSFEKKTYNTSLQHVVNFLSEKLRI